MSASEWGSAVWLALLWAAYGLIHSLLASSSVKSWSVATWPALGPAYRLIFNGLALVLLLPPLFLLYGTPWTPLWSWPGVSGWIMNGLSGGALLGFFLSSRQYDLRHFLGIRQWRGRSAMHSATCAVDEGAGLSISSWHRWVRHPWYALGLLLIWTRPMNVGFLVTAIWATLYLILGARLEEQKLRAWFGEAYEQYQRQVPALLPLPWRGLPQEEARRIEILSQQSVTHRQSP